MALPIHRPDTCHLSVAWGAARGLATGDNGVRLGWGVRACAVPCRCSNTPPSRGRCTESSSVFCDRTDHNDGAMCRNSFSADEFLALFCAVGAGLHAGLALGMLVGVLFALLLAFEAGVESNFGHGRRVI